MDGKLEGIQSRSDCFGEEEVEVVISLVVMMMIMMVRMGKNCVMSIIICVRRQTIRTKKSN